MSVLARVPVVAGPAFSDRIARLPSKFTATLVAEPDNRFHLAAVAVFVNGQKIGYLPPDVSRRYFGPVKNGPPAQCPGRRAPLSAHENTGVDALLDLTGIACEP